MTTTHPSANDSGLNLDHLEALARAATPGPWSLAKVIDRSIEHLCPVDRDRLSLLTVVHEGETPYGAVFRDEDAKFMAGIHPEQVLALIALARAALAHQPAQEQASTTRVTETKRAQLEARGYEVVGYVMQNSVNELCTLAHGRVEWLGKGTVTDYGTPAQQEPVAAPQQASRSKRLHEEEVREIAAEHIHDDTESAGRNGFFTFSAEGLDGFAIDLMDRAAQLDGGQEGSAS